MKRVVLLLPDTFDIGSVISLIGADLAAAYIGRYNPKKKLADPSQDESRLDLHIGPEGPPRVLPKGLSRPGSEGTDRPKRIEGKSLKEHVLTLAESGAWITPADVRKVIVPLGYNHHSADATLSALKIAGKLERQGTGPKSRYRKPIVLPVVLQAVK